MAFHLLQDKSIYGRMIRHREVEMCGIGALGFYLLMRFENTGELEKLDFTDNKEWFDIKLMVDCKASSLEDLSKSVNDSYYATAIKDVCRRLGLDAKHWIHFGRCMGPVRLEMEELDQQSIKLLGMWGMDCYDDRYSTKMPLKAMRVAAGFEPERGCHYNPRTQVLPPDLLCKMIFPEVEDLEKQVMEYERLTGATLRTARSGAAKTTAKAFLSLLKFLRVVIIQDAALLMNKRRKHAVFDLPVFKTPAFIAFQAHIVAAVNAANRNDPRDATLEAVIPRINQRFETSNQVMAAGFASVNSKQDIVMQELMNMQAMQRPMLAWCQHMGSFQYDPPRLIQPIPFQMNPSPALAPGVEPIAPAVAAAPPAASRTVPPAINGYVPAREYDSATTIYNEWNGIGLHSGPQGGIIALEDRFKTQWRSHFDVAASKRFSRMKKIVKTANELKTIENASIEIILQVLDAAFVDQKKSLGKMEKYIKNEYSTIKRQVEAKAMGMAFV